MSNNVIRVLLLIVTILGMPNKTDILPWIDWTSWGLPNIGRFSGRDY